MEICTPKVCTSNCTFWITTKRLVTSDKEKKFLSPKDLVL